MFDDLPFAEVHMNQLSIHAAPDRHGIRGGDGSKAAQIHIHVRFSRSNRENCGTARAAASPASSASAAAARSVGRRRRGIGREFCGFAPAISAVDETRSKERH